MGRRRKKSDRSEAQLIADKHNGNCFSLQGTVNNLERMMVECADVLEDDRIAELEHCIKCIQTNLREAIEQQYEYDKGQAVKPAAAVNSR